MDKNQALIETHFNWRHGIKLSLLPVWNVLVSRSVTIFLGKAKINNIDLISTPPQTHQKIIRLYVSMEERLRMNKLNTIYLGTKDSTFIRTIAQYCKRCNTSELSMR